MKCLKRIGLKKRVGKKLSKKGGILSKWVGALKRFGAVTNYEVDSNSI